MKPLVLDNYKAACAAGLFRVFGDADRVRIISTILEQEMNISTLAEMVGITKSAVSHHLQVLRQMRLVKARMALFLAPWIHDGIFFRKYPSAISSQSNQKESNMFTQLFHDWWLIAVRGALAIVFGILALFWLEPTKLVLVLLFGVFSIVDGIFAIATGTASRGYFERWWALLLEGITGIVIGVLAFYWPDVTALVLLYFIAVRAITTGFFEVLAAIEFRQVFPGEWTMIIGGLLPVLLGTLLFVFPAEGTVSLVWLISIYAILAGLIELIFAFRLWSLLREFETAVVSGA
jgi:uncharacterized membrane protein HdeD (DUF308 family)